MGVAGAWVFSFFLLWACDCVIALWPVRVAVAAWAACFLAWLRVVIRGELARVRCGVLLRISSNDEAMSREIECRECGVSEQARRGGEGRRADGFNSQMSYYRV